MDDDLREGYLYQSRCQAVIEFRSFCICFSIRNVRTLTAAKELSVLVPLFLHDTPRNAKY